MHKLFEYLKKNKALYKKIGIAISCALNILLVIFLFLSIQNLRVGSKIIKQFDERSTDASLVLATLDDKSTQLTVTSESLESCRKINQQKAEEIDVKSKLLLECQTFKDRLERENLKLMQDYETNITKSKLSYEEKLKTIQQKSENENLAAQEDRKRLENVINNAAINICCKMKIDDKTVNSYEVSDKITCSKDTDKKIDCSLFT